MHRQINTNFRKLEMLESAMACDSLKYDVNDATSILHEFDDVLHACEFVRRKSALCIKYFTFSLVGPSHFKLTY